MTTDFATVHQDDALINGLGAVVPTLPAGDVLAAILRAWRDDVDAEPIREFDSLRERLAS